MMTRCVTGGAAALCCIMFACVASAVNVDMDPQPRFPLRAGDYQHFLVHLSGAKGNASGTVSFRGLPDGLSAEPQERAFRLAPGEVKLLVFKVANSKWGKPAVVRPQVTLKNGGPVNFPAEIKTILVRDQAKLGKRPLDNAGLLAYFSCGDASPARYQFDRCVGYRRFWNEGIWFHPGGVRGRAVFGMNALPYPRHRWSKFAFDVLNNLYFRRGTILFWIRRSRRISEIPYTGRFRGDPATTWRLGPTAMRGHEGEGILGYIWSPQAIYTRWGLRSGRPWRPFKPSSDCFIGMRRYKAVRGLTGGFLEATYKAMRGKIYHVQAPYRLTEAWRHVALAWDIEQRRLEIYLDGELVSGAVMLNGAPSRDAVWYGAPWHTMTFCNAAMSICAVSAEGGRSATDRDEFYVYNRALSADEIRRNMRASIGAVVTPTIVPLGEVVRPAAAPDVKGFFETLTVEVRSLWSNPTHRYTTDGAEPTEASPAYTGPITLTKTTTVKVKSFLKGFKASGTATATFTSGGPDRRRPRIREVVALNDPNHVMVCFDEPVDKATAERAANYMINGVQVKAAKLNPDGQTVRLTTAKPLGRGNYGLKVSNVRDRSKARNAVDDQVVRVFRHRTLRGLVGYWSFDILSGPRVKDLSPYGIDGLAWDDLHPGATRVKGVRGKAIWLDGRDDLVDLTDYLDEKRLRVNPKSPHHLAGGTVVLWFKADPTGNGWKKALFCRTYAYHAFVANGNLMLSKIRVADNKWHHLAFVFQPERRGDITIYLDGKSVLKAKKRFLNNSRMGVGLGVGGGGFGQPKFFKGAIDEFMIFDRPLSADEVQSLHKTGELATTR